MCACIHVCTRMYLCMCNWVCVCVCVSVHVHVCVSYESHRLAYARQTWPTTFFRISHSKPPTSKHDCLSFVHSYLVRVRLGLPIPAIAGEWQQLFEYHCDCEKQRRHEVNIKYVITDAAHTHRPEWVLNGEWLTVGRLESEVEAEIGGRGGTRLEKEANDVGRLESERVR